MTSPRHAPALSVLLAIALVPTLIHSYAGMTVADGRTTKAVPSALAGFTSTPTSRNPGWGQRRFESDDWVERRYVSGSDEAILTVVRSYDLKRLYHHPELAVAYGTSFLEHDVARFPDRPGLPVHVLRAADAVAMYVLHYDDGFVDEPIRFQIRTAGELLFSGRRAMTLFFVNDVDVPPSVDLAALPSRRLLTGAIDAFIAPPLPASR